MLIGLAGESLEAGQVQRDLGIDLDAEPVEGACAKLYGELGRITARVTWETSLVRRLGFIGPLGRLYRHGVHGGHPALGIQEHQVDVDEAVRHIERPNLAVGKDENHAAVGRNLGDTLEAENSGGVVGGHVHRERLTAYPDGDRLRKTPKPVTAGRRADKCAKNRGEAGHRAEYTERDTI